MVLTYFSLLMPAFALPYTPANLPVHLRRIWNAPLPFFRIPRFGAMLEPRYIVCAGALDQ